MRYPFHLVDPSPWPLGISLGSFILASGGVIKFHGYIIGDIVLSIGFLLTLSTFLIWARDVVREGSFLGLHTQLVKNGIRIGVILFIISELFLFISFFWAFFHSSLSPSIELGSILPPVGIEKLNPNELPLLNTLILLSSGATVTVCHHAVISGNRPLGILYLLITIFLASAFIAFQWLEYTYAPFSIADSIYGSAFFLITGFHGFHVFVGTVLLTISYVRLLNYHFTNDHHLGFEGAIWYWHFVDIVWLFLYSTVYMV